MNLQTALTQVHEIAIFLKDRINISAADKQNILLKFDSIIALLQNEAKPQTRLEKIFNWLFYSVRQHVVFEAIEVIEDLKEQFSYTPARRFLNLDERARHFLEVLDGLLDTARELNQFIDEPHFKFTLQEITSVTPAKLPLLDANDTNGEGATAAR